MPPNDKVGFVDRITSDRLEVLGWVRLAEGRQPHVIALHGTDVLGIAELGSEREDVLRSTGLENRAFRIRVQDPLNAVEVLGGGVRLLSAWNGEEVPLPLSSGARANETLVALHELSSTSHGSTAPLILSGPTAPEGASYAAELEQNGRTGRLSPLNFPIGLKSRDNAAQLGHDGHIFLVGGSNRLLERYSATATTDTAAQVARDTEAWTTLFRNRHERLEREGVSFSQIVIPEKLTVMRDLAPVPITGPTPLLAEIERALSGDAFWVSGLAVFNNWRNPIPPWQRNDSHNSTAGSLAITRALLGNLPGCDTDVLDDVPLVSRSYRDGDLSERFFGIPLWDEHLDPEAAFLAAASEGVRLVTHKPAEGHIGTHMVWRNAAAPIQKSVVVFGNSFFGQSADTPSRLGWWFARLFGEYHFIWNPQVDHEYVDRVRPDYVIAQTIERFLGRVPAT